jgi:ELWxxDGT repeat protein
MHRQTVLFDGADANGNFGLWETDGFAAGTTEIGGLGNSGVSGAYSGGLFQGGSIPYLTDFTREALFTGKDASGYLGLWVTDGTAAGTTEIGGLGNSGVGGASFGLVPSDLTVFGTEALFEGTDASNYQGLWETNGSAGGTTEIGGIGNHGVSGAHLEGLEPQSMTVFNGEVLFDGADASGNQGLWVTNGTAAGTTEIGGLGNSGVSGAEQASGATLGGLFPIGLTVFNGEVLFTGNDANGDSTLWVTNGTAAGTTEIGGLGNSGVSGAFSTGLYPSYLTVFNGEVLFGGEDGSFKRGLWVTNGSAGGTFEIGGLGSTGISGANSGGLIPSSLTVFNDEVLFDGTDANGNQNLWVTNGTARGTYELTGISGANSGGLNPSYLTVFYGEVLFRGLDRSGNVGLWETNGTAAGTTEIGGLGNSGVSGANSGGLHSFGFEPTTFYVSPPENFNGNGKSDVLFRNASSGDTWVEAVINSQLSPTQEIAGAISNGAPSAPSPWQEIGGSNTSYTVAGVGDFYGTGNSDILFRNSSTGDTWFEAVSNGAFASWNQIGGSNTGYAVAGVGDFYGTGTDDILFRNTSTGDTWFEATNSNGAFNGWNQIGGSDTHYSVVGIGDFFESGTDDILFRNNSTGDTWVEAITNGAFAGWDQIGGSDTHYSVVGVGDFFGNGSDDILFRNNSTGDTWLEAINNGAFAGWTQIGGSDTTYSVAGIGDYFGTNTSDILFRNSATGDTWVEAISNGAFASWNQVGGSNTAYAVPITVGPPSLT